MRSWHRAASPACAGCCGSGMERAAAPWPELCWCSWTQGWLDARAAIICFRLLQRPPATCIAIAGADVAASMPAASCICTRLILTHTPPFLELTPSPALFPGQKGLVHLQAAPQHASAVRVLLFAGAVYGVRVQGACLPPYPGHWMPLKPPKSPCSQQPLSMLSQKTATAPFISGCIDPTKPSLYLRLSPPCSVLALAAGSCFLLVPKEREA